MKKLYKSILVLILSTVTIQSCNFLEVDPIGKTTIPKFFSDMEGLRASLPGTYSEVYNYYSTEFYKYPDVAGNMLYLNGIGTGADMVNQFNYTFTPENETEAVGYIWRKIYVAMANANNIIEYSPALEEKFPSHIQEIKFIRAQALFIRALSHFDLVRVYSQPYNYTADASHIGIPVLLKTPGPSSNLGRNSVKETYDQIEKDLKLSVVEFGTNPFKDAYHASKKASEALLSRVYLYKEQWDSVIKYSSLVIANTSLSTGSDYTDMYNKMAPGVESIFRLNGLKKSTTLGKFYNSQTPIYIPSDTLISLFDNPSDIRLSLLKNSEGKPVCLKYYITSQVAEIDKHYDPFVLRLSEIYLNRAEAYLNKNMLAEAAADVKQIIARAYGKTPAEITIDESSNEALAAVIIKERTKELCFEAHNLFDITRQKRSLVRESKTNSTVKKLSYPNKKFILPIPQTELNANPNMVQNPL